MIPRPLTRPTLLPARLALLGAAAGCAVLATQGVPSAEWPRFLAGLSVVSADGSTLADAMGGRVGTTLVLVSAAVMLAVTSGFAVAFAALRIGCGLSHLVGFIGRFVAAFPVLAVGWIAVGWIVGKNGWPIESLLPHHPAPGRDTPELSLGRWLWWWFVPCWTLALPLAGEFVSLTIDQVRAAQNSEVTTSLRARGLKRSVIHYHHVLPAAWPGLLATIEVLGLMALGYVVFIEEAFGIPGWGSFFASAIRLGDASAIAGSIYIAGLMSGAWCFCISLLRFLTTRRRAPSSPPSGSSDDSATKPAAVVASLAALVLAFCAFGESPAMAGLAALLGPQVSPLVHDLRMVAAACAAAVGLVMLRSALPPVLDRPLPRLGLLETFSWSPLLVWTLAAAALMRDSALVWIVPGVAVAAGGAVRISTHLTELRSSRAMEGSRAVGTGSIRAWRMHVLPGLFRAVLSWALEVSATLIIWVALIDALISAGGTAAPKSLGLAMAAAEDGVLSDLTPLVVPAVLVAISALFFNQLSRIVRPSPPPH